MLYHLFEGAWKFYVVRMRGLFVGIQNGSAIQKIESYIDNSSEFPWYGDLTLSSGCVSHD